MDRNRAESAGLWLLLACIAAAALWFEGAFPIGASFPVQMFVPAMISPLLAMKQQLDRMAEVALERLQPVVDAYADEHAYLRYQLTTMPAVPLIVASVAVVILICLIGLVTGQRDSSLDAPARSPFAANMLMAEHFVGWWVYGAFLYHAIRQ
jgi:hypothetical protein